MNLTVRQYQIIRLLKENISALSGNQLCSELDVSSRTLRYEISRINKYLGCDLIRSSREGYSIDASLDLSTIFNDIRLNDYLYIVKSVVILCLEEKDLSVYDIEDQCFVSKPVITNMLHLILHQMNKFDLQLYRTGDFISVKGTEFNKRRYLINLLFSETFDESTFCPESKNYFTGFELSDLQELVTSTIEDIGIHINDVYLKHIVNCTAVSLQRIMNGHITEKHAAAVVNFGEEHEAYLFLTSLLDKVFHKYKVKVLEEDFRSMLCFYVGSFRDTNANPLRMTILNNKEFEITIRRIMDRTLKQFNLHANYEPFFDRLLLHVYFLLLRAKTSSFVKNDITSTLKQTNPFIYDVSVFMAYLIQMEFKIEIPDEEIGFLAIYFGSVIINTINYSNSYTVICVCPNYNNLREQIEAQLLSMFNKRINIVKYVSSYSHISDDDTYDFIISVISNSYTFKNIVYVSPVIGPWEYQKINAMIIECEKKRQKEEIKALVLKYFQPDLFFYNEPYLKDMEIMQFLHSRMKDKGIVEDDFLDYVLKREELASTAFFNKFAIPHAINANARDTKVAYYYSDKPIRWFGSDVNLVLLMATKQYDKNFIRLYELIFAILMDKELYCKLLKCNSYEKMVDFISNQL